MNATQIKLARQMAVSWAQSVLKEDALIIDLETTGFRDAEIVQIGIIDMQRQILHDQLVRPTRRIPQDAIAIHGITNEMVAEAPTLPELFDELRSLLHGRKLIAYNSDFDHDILKQEIKRHAFQPIKADWSCAMKTYARFAGAWNASRRDFRWFKLVDACAREGITVSAAHTAAGDCLMTYELIQAMAL